jgi:hypothetical protein
VEEARHRKRHHLAAADQQTLPTSRYRRKPMSRSWR